MKFRPRYSLRVLLLLVTIAAIAAYWGTFQLEWIRKRHQFLTEHAQSPPRNSDNWAAPWQLRLFGEPGLPAVATELGEDYQEVQRLFPESSLVVE